MVSNLTIRLNNVKSLKIYWLFLYSYTDNVKRELPIDKILLFPVRIYTKSKSGSLPTIMVEKPLNLDSDSDLDMLIQKFGLNYVRSVSEMVISENTNLIAIQIDSSKKLKGYTNTNRLFFYSVDTSPEHYIRNDGLKNTSLSEKIKVSIGIKNIVSTSVTLGRIFSFIFKDHFEAVILDVDQNKESLINKDIEEVDEDGYDTDATTDSQMSLYSYNRKHNIKDI
jgi:hypothetical protein